MGTSWLDHGVFFAGVTPNIRLMRETSYSNVIGRVKSNKKLDWPKYKMSLSGYLSVSY